MRRLSLRDLVLLLILIDIIPLCCLRLWHRNADDITSLNDMLTAMYNLDVASLHIEHTLDNLALFPIVLQRIPYCVLHLHGFYTNNLILDNLAKMFHIVLASIELVRYR